MKIGRNEPCPCGSGKKYKHCHGPIDAERESFQRRLRQAPDTLIPKLMQALESFAGEMPGALQRFWNGAYQVEDVQELDQFEERGSERFLTWFAFDAVDAQGHTPVDRLIAAPEALELTEAEAQVFRQWGTVRLQPYAVIGIRKGFGLRLRRLFSDETLELEDHKAARRVEEGDVLIAHIVPAGDRAYITGAAAHLTPDTVLKLREFADAHLIDLQREQPAATYDDLIRTRSYIFNHFIMALPREPREAGKLDELVATTRATLNITAEQLGLRRPAADAAAPEERAHYEGTDD